MDQDILKGKRGKFKYWPCTKTRVLARYGRRDSRIVAEYQVRGSRAWYT
jgi:hypothetical protein